ncbi:thiamine ABC transporter substrate-binding protein [Roseinatronobacter bogoriensis]|uniref:Thiamine ABC transporter substrate-binding protein n=1 Tax=Roseinatronobacter bogoriensis subsp. barguzinensis TaxID=441209 RepID=A0A2K8KEW2_9RHOB|nr:MULTISPECIES: thiamine ABC transporter substrate-binding protein [Rhodobaca]ATX64680.1 thiamine ABC transporter substrate-binding protein [Rhodobaca barguzinensis]MBB4209480.1 thiamine transport system substrate-binding protein [Rhodobaca bogoriensis DSM 18756]TDW35154.1 thiamine transport system substrate-binding protein [Rhodobaca barguzinensis]TDY66836.1 thiamine transport system substrate-binding protein [Rhodobaca bogoriensis DSM 18756]
MTRPLYVTIAAMTLAGAAQADTLTVLAPDYFGSSWGPGPAIKEGFEAQCDCTVEFRTGDVLPRLMLDGARLEGDVIIGLGTDELLRARDTGLFTDHQQDLTCLSLPVEWADDIFIPFNWSHVAFVYDTTRLETPPGSFAELVERDDISLIWQDPRSSGAGLALLLWVDQLYGDDAQAIWENLAAKTVTVTAGWSEAYGMFTNGEADMVLSYTTSPAYHIMAEDDDTKAAAIFEEGHYFIAEAAGVLAGAAQPDLARDFMAYILSDEFQQMIATANWSYPSALPRDEWPEVFRDLPLPETAIFLSEDEADARRSPALAHWLEGMTR